MRVAKAETSRRRIAKPTDADVLIGAAEAGFAATGTDAPMLNQFGLRHLADRLGRFEPFAVDEILVERDPVGFGFRVLDTPGHSPGHISLWRERDRTLIAGDAASMIDLIRHGLAVGLLPSSFVAGINDISVVLIQRFAARRRRSTPDRGYPPLLTTIRAEP